MLITGTFVSYKERKNLPCELTIKHTESGYGGPVLMLEGAAYGPKDIEGAIIIEPKDYDVEECSVSEQCGPKWTKS